MGVQQVQIQESPTSRDPNSGASAWQIDPPGAAHAGGFDPNLKEVLPNVEPTLDPANTAECGIHTGGMGGVPNIFRRLGQGRVARSSSEHGAAHTSQLRLIHSNVICGGFIGVMILTNSVFIGIQTDVAAADWSAVVPPFFVVSALPRLLGAWLVR